MALEFVEDNPREPHWRKTGATSTTPVVVFLPPSVRIVKVFADVLSLIQTGAVPTAATVAAVNSVRTLSMNGAATGGTFTLMAMGRETVPIAYNASAATADAAVETILGAGTVTTTGGALPADVTFTFDVAPYAGTPSPNLSVGQNNVTGTGNPRPSLALTTTAVNPYSYVEANTQEYLSIDPTKVSFLYLATVTGTGNFRISGYK